MALLCKIFGHKFYWRLCSGDDGEPAEDQCHRCGLQTVHVGICRCLTPECVCLDGLFDAVRNGKIPGTPLVRHSDWKPNDVLYAEERVAAIIERREATQQEENEDFTPV